MLHVLLTGHAFVFTCGDVTGDYSMFTFGDDIRVMFKCLHVVMF